MQERDELIPRPPIVRERLARHPREARLLRRLLRLSVAAAEERHRETGSEPRREAAGRERRQMMTPSPRRKPAVDGPGPLRLATPHPQDVGLIDPPEDSRPEARPQRGSPRGPTLPAGFGRPPEAPTPTPWPNAEQSNRRTSHLVTHLLAGESAPAKREAIQEAAVMENDTETRSTHDLCYTIMQQGKSHGRYR